MPTPDPLTLITALTARVAALEAQVTALNAALTLLAAQSASPFLARMQEATR